jgi:hypothetical protein
MSIRTVPSPSTITHMEITSNVVGGGVRYRDYQVVYENGLTLYVEDYSEPQWRHIWDFLKNQPGTIKCKRNCFGNLVVI